MCLTTVIIYDGVNVGEGYICGGVRLRGTMSQGHCYCGKVEPSPGP